MPFSHTGFSSHPWLSPSPLPRNMALFLGLILSIMRGDGMSRKIGRLVRFTLKKVSMRRFTAEPEGVWKMEWEQGHRGSYLV